MLWTKTVDTCECNQRCNCGSEQWERWRTLEFKCQLQTRCRDDETVQADIWRQNQIQSNARAKKTESAAISTREGDDRKRGRRKNKSPQYDVAVTPKQVISSGAWKANMRTKVRYQQGATVEGITDSIQYDSQSQVHIKYPQVDHGSCTHNLSDQESGFLQ